jgi:hypothetical protein
MILLKGDQEYEDGAMPSEAYFAEMGKFNEQLVKAGLMLAGEGLQPSSRGASVKISGSRRVVTDGPFAEAKELIAGFWIWNVKSKQEAIEWVKRIPMPTLDTDTEIEIRELFETSCTPECGSGESHARQNAEAAAKR